jgi:hypothetical protein
MSASPADVFSFPGPIRIPRTQSPAMLLEVIDNDLDDSLYVRLYRDYRSEEIEEVNGDPTPFLTECQAGPSLVRERSIRCVTDFLCTSVPDDNRDHVLEAMVADQPFIPDSDPEAVGQDPFRALQNPRTASWSIRSWVMRCEPR